MCNPDSPNYLDLCGMNVIVKTQKDYTFMHGLAEIIYLLPHFSDKIHFFTAENHLCVFSWEKKPCLSALFKGKKLSAAYLSSEQSSEC